MKITCLVDSLNSGGAQRQICMLAIFLKRRGFEVQVVTYHKYEFFSHLLENENIQNQNVRSKNKIHRIIAVGKAIQKSNPDVVISFLNIPSLICEISGFPLRKYGLIVSERNIEPFGLTFKAFTRFSFHALADAVVANSYAKTNFMKKAAPWLKNKTTTITNCVDLEKFSPSASENSSGENNLSLVVLGRLEPQKNPMALLSAIQIVKEEHPSLNIVVDWYGNNFYHDGQPTRKSALYLELQKGIGDAGLQDIFRLHQPCQNVVEVYQGASVVCLPSLWEGCSNVIGEAMACGKPILASRVGDNEVLVEEGENGFLFDPKAPRDIADSILRFAAMPSDQRRQMSEKSRQRAESILSPTVFVDKYVKLIEEVRQERR